MKEKIKEILVDVYKINGRLEDEATEQIFNLFKNSYDPNKNVSIDNLIGNMFVINTSEKSDLENLKSEVSKVLLEVLSNSQS